MAKLHRIHHLFALLALGGLLAACSKPAPTGKEPVRVAVSGVLTVIGLWDQLARQFEQQTGIPVVLVTTGTKEAVTAAARKGKVDLVVMHSNYEAGLLIKEGVTLDSRPWTRTESVIMGPASDPAGIRGAKDAAAALKQIAQTRSPFVTDHGGKRLLSEKLWKKTGLTPAGDWVIRDDSASATDLIRFAQTKGAYFITELSPALQKATAASAMQIMVEGDPDLHGTIVLEKTNPARFPATNTLGAQKLADFLLSPAGQQILRQFADAQPAGAPVFYPLK